MWFTLTCLLLGIWPSTQACALDWESNQQPFDLKAGTQPLSHTSQGSVTFFTVHFFFSRKSRSCTHLPTLIHDNGLLCIFTFSIAGFLQLCHLKLHFPSRNLFSLSPSEMVVAPSTYSKQPGLRGGVSVVGNLFSPSCHIPIIPLHPHLGYLPHFLTAVNIQPLWPFPSFTKVSENQVKDFHFRAKPAIILRDYGSMEVTYPISKCKASCLPQIKGLQPPFYSTHSLPSQDLVIKQNRSHCKKLIKKNSTFKIQYPFFQLSNSEILILPAL